MRDRGAQVDLNKAVGSDKLPAEIATAVRNNGGGHWNHSFFWKVMTSPTNSNGPSAELKAAIDAAFGSVDEMKQKFNAAAAGRWGRGAGPCVAPAGLRAVQHRCRAAPEKKLPATIAAQVWLWLGVAGREGRQAGHHEHAQPGQPADGCG